MNREGYKVLTPRRMTALHWANRDFKAAAAKTEQTAVEMERKEEVKASQIAAANEQCGGETKAVTDGAGPATGKLRNDKTRGIGRRLGTN